MSSWMALLGRCGWCFWLWCCCCCWCYLCFKMDFRFWFQSKKQNAIPFIFGVQMSVCVCVSVCVWERAIVTCVRAWVRVRAGTCASSVERKSKRENTNVSYRAQVGDWMMNERKRESVRASHRERERERRETLSESCCCHCVCGWSNARIKTATKASGIEKVQKYRKPSTFGFWCSFVLFRRWSKRKNGRLKTSWKDWIRFFSTKIHFWRAVGEAAVLLTMTSHGSLQRCPCNPSCLAACIRTSPSNNSVKK